MLTKDKSFYKNLITLAIPIMLQNLVTYSVGLADHIMIGSLGDSAVSGVYMGNQLQTALQVLSAGIEGGILLLCAQYWGKRNTVAIKKVIAVGMRISFILGAFFTTVCVIAPKFVIGIFTDEPAVIEKGVEYLSIVCFSFIFFCITQSLIASMRSVENARIGMIVSFCSLCIDVSLNYILINGKLGFPRMGVCGAAIATLIARVCETAIIFIYVRFVDKKLALKFKELLHIDKVIFKDFIRYGMPIILGQLVWGANLMANSIILGHFGEGVITAVSLANTVNNLMYVAMNGLSAAVGIIIGKTVGSGDISRIKEYSRTVQLMFLCLGILTSLMFWGIREPFISLYKISDEAVGYARQFINVLRVTCIGTCYQAACLFGLVKSGGDVKFVFKNDLIFVFLIVIPSALVASYVGLSPWVVYAYLKCDQILKCIPAFIKIRRYNWMKNLTRDSV